MLVLRVGTIPLRDDEARLLRYAGVSCERTGSGRELLEFLRLYDYDLALIDLELPDMPGDEAIRLARAAGLVVPSILLALTADARTRIRALERGADDFVMMPCDPDEVMARVRAVVRRSQGHAHSALRFGPVELNLDRHEVRVHGEKLRISRREFGVLELLFLKRGVILNKNAFLNHLYTGLEEPMGKTIDVIMCRLRKKFAALGVPHLIDTVWGCGYILREPVPIAAE